MTRLTVEDFAPAVGPPQPRPSALLLTREAGMTLTKLERDGMKVEASYGPAVAVGFKRLGRPRRAQRATGWKCVRIRSQFGAVSTLLYEAHEGGRISGLLRLRQRRMVEVAA